MDPVRWQKIEAIFQAALELDADRREAFVKASCGDDQSLFEECMALLKEDEREHSLLDAKPGEALEILSDMAYEGRRIGAYQVLRKIGDGGMGLVFLAERADGQFSQQVALKVIKRGMDSEDILRRFHSEREILARLQHPNIARLYDGGLTDDGLPYFTMEYIQGEPIDVYCDRRQLGITRRLELFHTVGRAVAYAQQNLVVHRDLKPSNILVTENGTVKLLDFGIAKVLSHDPEGGDAPALTRTGMRALTPGYASPEQFRSEAVTTASDVYSLGVVLYQLLTGRRPRAASHSPLGQGQDKNTAEPGKPSSLVTRKASGDAKGGDNTVDQISRNRSTLPDKLRRRLNGDLDNICLKALRFEPADRYHSAEQLSEDIRRHLRGQPIAARPDSFAYRARKFVRRNRAAVSVIVVVLVVVTAMVTFYTRQLAHERDIARREAEKAAQVSAFSTSLFELFDPVETEGANVSIRDLLDQGVRRIDSELSRQPEIQARMYDVVGNVYATLGNFDTAQALFEKGLALRQGLVEAEPMDIANSYRNLSMVAYEKGFLDSSANLTRNSLAIVLAETGGNSLEAARDYHELATALRHQGAYTEARDLYEKALAIRIRELGERHVDVAYTLNHLSRLALAVGDPEEAERLARRALLIRNDLLGPDNPETAASRGSVANLLARQGRNAEAAQLYRESNESFRRVLGERHPYTVGTLASLGVTYYRMDSLAIADSILRQSLGILREILPAGHRRTAGNIMSLGKVVSERESAAAAEPYFREALAIYIGALPDDHYEVAAARHELGRVLLAQGKLGEVEALLTRAYGARESLYGADDPSAIETARLLADLYTRLDRPENAERFRALSQASSTGQ